MGDKRVLKFFFGESKKRKSNEQDRREEKGERRVTPSPGMSAVYETSPKLTGFCVPEHGVFVVPNLLQELHVPVTDVLYVAEVRLHGKSRYNVGAAVGLGLISLWSQG